MRSADFGVSLPQLVVECRRLAKPTKLDGSLRALQYRVYQLLGKWDQTWRRATHKAQNTRFSTDVIADFLEYIHGKIHLLSVDFSCIYNVDKTNVFFYTGVEVHVRKERVENSVSKIC